MAFHFKWSILIVSSIFLFVLAKDNRSCPYQEAILPCRCLQRQDEIQIWCSHSNLPKTLEALQTVGQYVKGPIDELILENNNLPSLPGRAFFSLKIMRLMFRNNGLERVSNTWLAGLEDTLMELFLVEPNLRSLPDDSLTRMSKLEAVTLQTNHLKRVPDFSGLQNLRYIQIESPSLTELSPRHFRSLPVLGQIHIVKSPRLSRLEGGLLEALPSLVLVNISYCGISWIHPRAISHLPALTDLYLIGNKITEAAMVGRSIKDLPSLENLYLDYNYIEKLGEASFVDLPALKKLHISNNRITELDHGAFHKVPKLRFIDLSRNLVRQVHPESFLQHSGSGLEELWLVQNDITHIAELRSLLDALPRLTFLDLSYNNLEAIPFGTLRGHPTLEHLHLDHNKLRIIDTEAFMAMPALTELRLKNNSLSDVLEGPLWNLPGLKGLDLSYNYIQRLEPQFLSNLPSLRRIDLSGNGLTVIDPTAFLETSALEHVNLSHNEITALHPATFRHLPNLYELDVHFNRLKDFIPGLPRGIEYLYLSDNQIDHIPPAPSPDLDLPALKTLDLTMNRIQRIPPRALQSLLQLKKLLIGKNDLVHLKSGTFKGLKNLQMLDFHKNRITVIDPDTFDEVTEIREFIVKENDLSILRIEVIRSMPNLRRLDISKNKITELLPETFDRTRKLEIFEASYNFLTDLPASMFELKELNKLDLSYNRFRIISPDVLKTLDSLTELHLSHNLIEKLTTGAFENLPMLEILNMDNNNLETIQTNSLLTLPKLKTLNLSQNKLQELPNRSFSNLPSLEIAELQENHLQKIADNAFHLVPNLLLLNLSTNFLSSLEDAGLQSIRSLEMLDISNNRLLKIANLSLEKMEWLVELRLDDNRICAVHGSPFNSMYRLKVLSLRNNKLLSFPENAVKRLRGNLVIIDLNGNPLICSCNLLWLKVWVEESFQKGPTCADGTLLREIRLSHQDCRKDENQMEPVAPGCESGLSSDNRFLGTSQVFAQNSNLKRNKTTVLVNPSNDLIPHPQESDYFYDEYVDYPFNESMLESIHNEHTNPKSQFPKSSHFISGDTPTIYAATSNSSIKLKNSLPDIPRNVSNSPSSSGFTFFGLPLPNFSLNTLWNPRGRMSVTHRLDEEFQKKRAMILNNTLPNFKLPNVEEGGFVPIIPGTGGFIPIPGPRVTSVDQNSNYTKDKEINENPKNAGQSSVPLLKKNFTLVESKKSLEETLTFESSTIIDDTSPTTVTITTTENTTTKRTDDKQLNTILKSNVTNNKSENIIRHLNPSNESNDTTRLFNTIDYSSKHSTPTTSLFQRVKETVTSSLSKSLNTTPFTLSAPGLVTSFVQSTEKNFFKDYPVIETAEQNKDTTEISKERSFPSPSLSGISTGVQSQYPHPGKITRVQSPYFPSPLYSDRKDPIETSLAKRNKNKEVEIETTTHNNNERDKDDMGWYFANYNNTNQKPYLDILNENKANKVSSFSYFVWDFKLIFVAFAVVYNFVMY